MYKVIMVLLILCLPVFGANYGVYRPQDYTADNITERVLFILDYSNSMNEFLEGRRKVDFMVETMRKILPSINSGIEVGLRVYGHKNGLSSLDACRASSIIEPIGKNSVFGIEESLQKLKPKGMTPITYSLKQAVKNDFMGFKGKKRIILLTDGGENCDESPCKYAMELIKLRSDINIDVIAFNISDREDLSQLECAALVTSGSFYNAQTSAELVNSLTNSINSLKKVEAKIIKKP